MDVYQLRCHLFDFFKHNVLELLHSSCSAYCLVKLVTVHVFSKFITDYYLVQQTYANRDIMIVMVSMYTYEVIA